jgi:Tol biopolymer transport system component/C-terminal processing protease CtpA/Prc
MRTVVVASLLALALFTTARAEDPAVKGAKSACYAPDGRTIFFGLRGDIWRAPAEGGEAVRITLHEANDIRPRVSPDGTKVAFSSKRSGNYDIWIMPVEGGTPRQLTFHEASDLVSDWSPDGATILFYSNREGSFDLYTIPAEGGTPRRLTYDGGVQGRFSPDGRTIVYVRGAVALTMKQYRGSSNFDVYTVPVEGGTPTRLTKTPWNERDPIFSAGGDWVYYAAEAGKSYEIHKIPAAGGEAVKVCDSQGDATGLALSPDGKKILFQEGFSLRAVELATGEVRDVPIRVRSDVKGGTIESRLLTSGAKTPSCSPDGTKIAFSLRGDIWVAPANGGKATRLTSGPGNDEWPRFSPDGKKIAFQSNVRGNVDLYVVASTGGEPKRITTSPADDFYHSWSPDGKWLVYASEANGNRDIWKIASDGSGEPIPLTRDPGSDDDPCFSPDGEWIAFDSARSGNQDIWIMKADGTGLRQLTTGNGTEQVPTWSPDGKLIAFESERGGRRGIWAISSRGGPEIQIAAEGSTPFWAPTGERILYEGGNSGIAQVPAPKEIVAGSEVPFLAEIEVDRKKEWKQVFEEAWLAIKDGFYDPKLHGVDWEAVKKKYAPLVAEVEIHDDLMELIDQMLGELRASHMGITPPRDEDGPEMRTGYLGMALAPIADGKPGMLVTDVVPGGPADQVWIRPGDRIFAIDERPLDSRTNIFELLANKVDRPLKLEVGSGTTSDRRAARTLTVKAVSRGAIRELEYARWVKKREQRVADRSGGKLGYIHLNAMNQENLRRFVGALSGPLKDKAGLVIDVRNNGGGNIHQQLLDILSRKPYIYYDPRAGDRTLQETPVWAKPACVLVNERSYSDAEIFPYGFKTLQLGKVIGAPTSGGVIGTGSRTLIDGSTLRMPSVGWYGLDGTNLERLGVEPDIVVEETAEDRAKDRDPQLDRAIDEMMAAIGVEPKPAPAPTEDRGPGPEAKDRHGPF